MPCEWPPKFQSFEEYKAELDEAVDAHPPFGVWLRMYRNVNHVTTFRSQEAMWGLPVLAEREPEKSHQECQTRLYRDALGGEQGGLREQNIQVKCTH